MPIATYIVHMVGDEKDLKMWCLHTAIKSPDNIKRWTQEQNVGHSCLFYCFHMMPVAQAELCEHNYSPCG